jgi:uncharacterized membrane protein YjjB (DUF3815 family)
MGLSAMAVNSFWAGIVASGMAIIFTLPFRYIMPSFVCGFAGRLARDLLVSWGAGMNWSTAVASAVVVLAAVALIRRNDLSPAVLITGVLPLGAALSMFDAIIGLMKVSVFTGEALAAETVTLSANIGKVITTSLAMALGLAIGLAIVRLKKGKKVLV